MTSRESQIADGAPLRVLVVIEQSRPTGLVRQLLEVLPRLRSLDVTPHVVVVSRSGTDPSELLDALSARDIEGESVVESRAWDRGPVRAIREIISMWQPDLIQTHGYKSSAYAALLGAGRSGLPWLAFYHGRTTTSLRVRLYHALERWLVGRASAIAPVAVGVESHFRRRDRHRLSPIPNGVMPPELAGRGRTEVRADLGVADGTTLVGFVGRLSHEKGPDLFVRTLSRLQEEDGDYSGVVAGDGPMSDSIRTAVASSGLGDRVRLLGRIENVRDLYEGIDTLLISSRSEVFPNVLLEAVDAGVPVAAGPVGGIPDIALGISSVVVAADTTPARLAAAVVEASRTAEPARLEARRKLRERYSQQRRAELLVSLYRQIVDGAE